MGRLLQSAVRQSCAINIITSATAHSTMHTRVAWGGSIKARALYLISNACAAQYMAVELRIAQAIMTLRVDQS